MTGNLMTTREVAERFRVSVEMVRQWVHEGRLNPVSSKRRRAFCDGGSNAQINKRKKASRVGWPYVSSRVVRLFVSCESGGVSLTHLLSRGAMRRTQQGRCQLTSQQTSWTTLLQNM